jgi:hypothetical protein
LGSAAFKPVKNDMVGNIKVRDYLEAIERSRHGLTPSRKSVTDSSLPRLFQKLSKTSSSTS